MKPFKKFFVLGGISYLFFVVPSYFLLLEVGKEERFLRLALLSSIPFLMVLMTIWSGSKLLHILSRVSMVIAIIASAMLVIMALSGDTGRWAFIPFIVSMLLGVGALEEYDCVTGEKEIIDCI